VKSAEPVSVADDPSRHGWRRWLTFGAWLVATALVIACARSVRWTDVGGLVRTIRVPWLALAVVLNATILVFWAALWRAVLPAGESVRYAQMFEINAIASALMNTVPFLVGHAAAVVMLVKRAKVTRAGALSVLALDQLGEGVAKAVVLLVVALSAPIPVWMRAGVALVTCGVAALLCALVLAARMHRPGKSRRQPSEPTPTPDGVSRILARARAFVVRWAQGLDALRSWRRASSALSYALATKAADALAIVAVQRSFGLTISFGGTMLVLAAMLLATMIPVAPGNVGTYEGSVFLAYRFLGVPPDQALGLALVQHVCFMIPAVGIGYAMLSRRAVVDRWLPRAPRPG